MRTDRKHPARVSTRLSQDALDAGWQAMVVRKSGVLRCSDCRVQLEQGEIVVARHPDRLACGRCARDLNLFAYLPGPDPSPPEAPPGRRST